MQGVVDRTTGKESWDRPSVSQRFLYRSLFGRFLLKILISPWISKLSGAYMNCRISKIHIRRFVKKNDIQLEEYEEKKYSSFNDFFTRKIKKERRPIELDPKIFISPCDAKLSVYKINETSIFEIKGSFYTISDLLEDDSLASLYKNGYCLVFRLGVTDYHRYGYIDDGYQEKSVNIKGIFHTVHPISLEKYNFFKKNHRIYTMLHTINFGEVVQVEVGAMMVGRIKNHYQQYSFKKGEEKGYFMFGGSTIVLLIKDILKIDEDILYQSQNNKEITVRYGERIGCLK